MATDRKQELTKLLKKHRADIDDYVNSVRALYALANELTFDHESKRQRVGTRFRAPRTMSCITDTGAVRDLTPDAVIQVSDEYGVIAEMKKNFPVAKPDSPFEQVAKYDTPLTGWWTTDEKIGRHDLVLMTHEFSGVKAGDAHKDWVARGNGFSRNFAIVEFGYQEQGQLWFFLRRREGSLSDQEHDERLRQGVKINDTHIVELFDRWKFSEQEPPLIYMLLLVHTYVLPLFPRQEEYERVNGARQLTVEVDAEQVRDKMVEQFSPVAEARQPQVPKLDWVKRALSTMERLGLATALNRERCLYRVSLARFRRKDTVEYFTERIFTLHEKSVKKSQPTQPDLFGTRADNGS